MTLLAIAWNPDPVLVQVGGLAIRYYSLCWTLGIVLGYLLLFYFARQEKFPDSIVDRMAIGSVLGVYIGARIGHCLVYDPAHYLANPLEIFKVWEGGLASHGGIVGVLIAMYIVSRRSKVSMLWIMDHVAIPIALIATFIRVGNLMNSEIYGHATDLPWGMIFLRNGETIAKHPTQIYEALSYFTLFLTMMGLYKWRPALRQQRGFFFFFAMATMFTARFLIEFIKEIQSPFEAEWFFNLGQWQSLPFMLVGIPMLVYVLRRPAEPIREWPKNDPKSDKSRAERRRR